MGLRKTQLKKFIAEAPALAGLGPDLRLDDQPKRLQEGIADIDGQLGTTLEEVAQFFQQTLDFLPNTTNGLAFKKRYGISSRGDA